MPAMECKALSFLETRMGTGQYAELRYWGYVLSGQVVTTVFDGPGSILGQFC
jgi:hypothetical protein